MNPYDDNPRASARARVEPYPYGHDSDREYEDAYSPRGDYSPEYADGPSGGFAASAPVTGRAVVGRASAPVGRAPAPTGPESGGWHDGNAVHRPSGNAGPWPGGNSDPNGWPGGS